MLARLNSYLPEDKNKRAILFTGALLILAAFALYFLRALGQVFSGEAFYDFQYPYRLPLLASWKVFFLDRIRSRLLHGVFISSLYHLFGFNPPAIYLSIYLLLIFTAIIIALILSDFIKRPWLAGLFTAAFALLPLGVPEMFQLKKAHHVLAWFLFWLAVLLLKKWAIASKRIWLILGTLAFMASVLAYEATIALLPVAVLICLAHLRDFKDFWQKMGLILFITLCTAFAFLRLEDLKQYSSIGQVYPDYSNITVSIGKAFSLIPQVMAAIWRGSLFSSYISANGWLLVIGRLAIALCLLFAAVAAVSAIRRPVSKKKNPFAPLQNESMALLLTGLYLTFATYLPFMLAGQAPDGDSLRGAAFGLLLVALAATNGLRQQGFRLAESLVGFACVLSIVIGALNYSAALQQARVEDHKLNTFIFTLKQQVPGVRAGTVFIFVNAQFSRTGCLGMLNMLYSKNDLQCIHLIDNDVQEQYTRQDDGLLLKGGRLFPPNFVVLTFDENGNAILLDQILEGQYPLLPLTWEIMEPIRTNPNVILKGPESYGEDLSKSEEASIKMLRKQKPSVFYDYILAQRAEMNW